MKYITISLNDKQGKLMHRWSMLRDSLRIELPYNIEPGWILLIEQPKKEKEKETQDE